MYPPIFQSNTSTYIRYNPGPVAVDLSSRIAYIPATEVDEGPPMITILKVKFPPAGSSGSVAKVIGDLPYQVSHIMGLGYVRTDQKLYVLNEEWQDNTTEFGYWDVSHPGGYYHLIGYLKYVPSVYSKFTLNTRPITYSLTHSLTLLHTYTHTQVDTFTHAHIHTYSHKHAHNTQDTRHTQLNI